MSTLIRETFKTSRLAEFCSQKELVNQTGHEVEDWPLVILKELFDNALDGAEEAGIAPVIAVTINADGITVTDNGPGIDADTVTDITDYTSKILADARPEIVPFVSNYAVLNPHLSLSLEFGKDGDVGAGKWSVPAIDPTWRKWLPSDPTSPHWYDVPRLARLIGANIARAQDRHEPCKTVRDFVGEFRGLARTQLRALVCEAVGASRLSLDQFFGNGTDLRRTGKLLDEMRRYSAAILPKALGAIGQGPLAAKFEAFGVAPSSFEYKTAAFNCDGVPYLVEAAFGYCPTSREERRFINRRIITGINWSVAIGDPFRELGEFEQSLGEILTEQKAGQGEPIVFALHVACPRIDYLDRGKSAVALPDVPRETIVSLVMDVTKRWAKQRKAEEKDASARLRRYERMVDRDRPMTQIEAAAQVLRDAYLKANDGGQLPATARQIYYVARPLMLALTGKSTIGYNYFSQTLLINFLKENEKECGGWDVVWDDRGHFEEPHGGEVVGLGTLSVREYLDGTHNLEISPAGFKGVAIETRGAHGRFGALLFIEKEGFRDLFKSVRLADRFDIAIMSSKGNSVTAARQLADRICSERNIPLLTLHDFDVYGFKIGQIGEDNDRYTFENDIKVINIGLRLDDILDIDGADLDAYPSRAPRAAISARSLRRAARPRTKSIFFSARASSRTRAPAVSS